MTVPANRVNLITNPSAEAAAWGAAGSGAGTISLSTTQKFSGTQSSKFVWTSGSWGAQITPTVTVTPSTTYTMSLYVYLESGTAPSVPWNITDNAYANSVTMTGTPVIGQWVRISKTFTTAAAQTTVLAYCASTAAATYYVDAVMLEQSATLGNYFDGSLPPDSSYRYFYTGTANASTSQAEYRGVWVELAAGAGAPAAQVTVNGIGPVAGVVQVTRTADAETWTVPGWYARSVVSADTDKDYAVPLGRTVTYTAYLNGQQLNQMSITVNSATGWIQSPYDPSTAMPINTLYTNPGVLTMGNGSLESRTHVTNAGKAQVMGSKRQHSIGGQRLLDGSFIITLNAHQNTVSDALRAIISATPILLIRGLPSWGSLPGLAYTDAPAQEFAVNRGRLSPSNNALTQWTISGELVVPVSRQVVAGTITNDMVQTNLAGTTYTTIYGRSGGKRYVDIKAAPLSL